MKKSIRTQKLDSQFQNEKLERNQMNYLRGGDGPNGAQDLGDDLPPIKRP